MIVQVENPVIEVHDMTVSYDKKPVLWGVDFSLPAGKLIGIIGPNGSGKTTLLKSMMGLLPLNSGYVKLLHENIEDVRDKISYVPQKESVDWNFPASVLDIVIMGRYRKRGLLRRISAEDKQIALNCLDKVGMASYKDRQISQLSGGQQQRVFLARSLAQDADIYLMDEPFNGIDATTERTIIDLLRTLRHEGKTIIVVHHDLQSAVEYFDWFILLNTRLIASGPKDMTFTQELLQETYGGKLTLLTKVGDLLKEKAFPMRESK